jgi:hypothetical protein
VQNKDDGTHAILPVATPSKGAMDHAGLPVMLLRHSHGKMRRDGSRAAWMQHNFAVDERGRLHSAPGLVHVVVSRGQASIRGPCRNRGDHRQWVRNRKTPDRLRRQDKSRKVRPVGWLAFQ